MVKAKYLLAQNIEVFVSFIWMNRVYSNNLSMFWLPFFLVRFAIFNDGWQKNIISLLGCWELVWEVGCVSTCVCVLPHVLENYDLSRLNYKFSSWIGWSWDFKYLIDLLTFNFVSNRSLNFKVSNRSFNWISIVWLVLNLFDIFKNSQNLKI